MPECATCGRVTISTWCSTPCQVVFNEPDRLRDFTKIESDGVDYTNTNHPRYIASRTNKVGLSVPGWADIVAGKCKCKQCEQARFAHTVKQMVTESKKQLRNS